VEPGGVFQWIWGLLGDFNGINRQKGANKLYNCLTELKQWAVLLGLGTNFLSRWRASELKKMGAEKGFSSALALTLVAVLLLGSVAFVGISFANLDPHAPIHIVGNEKFTPAKGVNGGGSGTEDDPYIIENWVINASTYGIWIEDTTAYFIIRNCLVENGYRGIYLDNVTNGQIEKNVCNNNIVGICVKDSTACTIIKNHCVSVIAGSVGIFLYYSNGNCVDNNIVGLGYGDINIEVKGSDHNIISNNLLENNQNGDGIWLWSGSDNNVICYNTCRNNFSGIALSSSDNNVVHHNYLLSNCLYNANDTGTNNAWDNGSEGNWWDDWQPPEHPDADGDGIVDEPCPIPGGASQEDRYPLVIDIKPHDSIYIEGDDDFTSANGVIAGSGTASFPYIIGYWVIDAPPAAHGIYIEDTTAHFIIRDCIVENGVSTIFLSNVVNGRVEKCIVRNSWWSIELYGSSNIILENNTCVNGVAGIYLCSSDSNIVSNNTCKNNEYGIALEDSSNNTISNNTCENNDVVGIYINASNNNDFTYNTCENNDYGIYAESNTKNNTIHHNYLLNNRENNAYDGSSGFWKNSWNGSEGNWWSDWQPPEHPDADGDGIVDNRRLIAGGSCKDRYPLVIPVCRVEVSISPDEESGLPGENVIFTVTVTNTGTVEDTYDLSVSDTEGWVVIGTTQIRRSDDTYVDYRYPDTNYGTEPDLWANQYNRSYLKFDINGVVPSGAVIESAKLFLKGYWTWGDSSGYVSAYEVDNDNWLESEATWNNSPTVGAYISTNPNPIMDFSLQKHEWNVKNWVKNQLAVDNTVSICLDNNSAHALFYTEWLHKPYLKITFGRAISPPTLTIPPGESRTATLTVTIPEDAPIGTVDNITVIATSQENEDISDNASCIACAVPWDGTATFKLENLYAVSLEKDLQLNVGSKLVVKFYKYGDTLQVESIIHEFTPPESVGGNENVPHPLGKLVEVVTLVLTTDNTENEISEIASFTVHQSDLSARYIEILIDWAGHPELQDAFMAEMIDILLQWSSAPP
jgi:parallel beta-helix repeat protein